MKLKHRRWLPVLLAGATLAAPLVPAAAVTDFQLPPSNQPRAQGPVVPGEPVPRTATPSPRPSPTPAPAPSSPVPVITVPQAAPSVTPSRTPPAARPTAAAPAATPTPVASAPASPAPTPTAAPAFNPLAQDRPPVAASEAPIAAPIAPPARTNDIAPWWPLAAGGVALLAILGGLAFLFARRRQQRADAAPEIERPVVVRPSVAPQAPAPQPAAPPPEPEAEPDHGPLSIAVEARELTISFAAATLAYRITLTNTGEAALGGVEIAGDMVSAHASLSLEDQLASADAPLAPKHAIERIRPGESVQVTGEFRLPFQAIRPIMQGGATLLVPLARLRIHAAQGGNGALIKTALVGQRATRPGAGLQPFRLDLGPRIYREVTQKIF